MAIDETHYRLQTPATDRWGFRPSMTTPGAVTVTVVHAITLDLVPDQIHAPGHGLALPTAGRQPASKTTSPST